MSDSHDVFTEHYRLLQSDPAARRQLIADPISGLKAYFGSVPDGFYRVEVVSQEPDTITILLPAAAFMTCCSPTASAATWFPMKRSPGFCAICVRGGPPLRRTRTSIDLAQPAMDDCSASMFCTRST